MQNSWTLQQHWGLDTLQQSSQLIPAKDLLAVFGKINPCSKSFKEGRAMVRESIVTDLEEPLPPKKIHMAFNGYEDYRLPSKSNRTIC